MENSNELRIWIASLPRSGGTWLFNAASQISRTRHNSTSASWIGDYEPGRPGVVEIIKVHDPADYRRHKIEYRSFQSEIIVFSFRDLRGILNSLIRLKWAKPEHVDLRHHALTLCYFYKYWHQRCNLTIDYRDIVQNKEKVVFDIGELLNINLTKSGVEDIIIGVDQSLASAKERLGSLPAGKHDKLTLMHQNHIAETVYEDYVCDLYDDLKEELKLVFPDSPL